ncbi:MAG: hypothetical protein D6732_12450 [Methanobacteriota archaeon]|nr:MAG: hypothetical protein D6732_12450 [Euryarchaeota archaeon]
MASWVVVTLNLLSTLIGLFCFYVTVRLWQRHRLNRTLFFVGTGFFFTMWNFSHLLNNFVVTRSVARGIFTWGFFSGFLFVACALFGFSLLRRNEITWEMLAYAVILSSFFTYYVARPEVMGLVYTEDEGWFAVAGNPMYWNMFIAFLFVANTYELMVPLYQAQRLSNRQTRPKVIVLLLSIALATFSAALVKPLNFLPLPNVFRFVLPGIGFFFFFYLLNKYPFLGFHDGCIIHEVLVVTESGLPIYSPLSMEGQNYLNSGAILGVSFMFDEISRNAGIDSKSTNEKFRRIELESNEFFIASVRKYNVIFNYSNPSGITLQKMKSLARIFWKRQDPARLLERFERDLKLFFPTLKLMETGIQKR